MSFAVSLKEVAKEIDRLLGALLRLEAAAAPRVVEAMRYAALARASGCGRSFWPKSAKLLGARRDHALRAGAALECVHCYSLVHDDLPAMDDDDLRRGRPTCHKAFDEATAILAGDGLLTLAFEIVSDPLTHPDPAVRSQLVLELARAAGHAGMVGGQMLDLEAEAGGCGDMDAIVRLQSMKTGALFRYALEAGAILAQTDGAARAALSAMPTRSAWRSRSPTISSMSNRPLSNSARPPRKTEAPARRPSSTCSVWTGRAARPASWSRRPLLPSTPSARRPTHSGRRPASSLSGATRTRVFRWQAGPAAPLFPFAVTAMTAKQSPSVTL
jgi:farnesyl diphosphate synthase